MEWSEDVIGQLTTLWAEGHSTAEIGRRLGVSKNAVVGKAHRLNLLARPSPIRRGAAVAPARVPATRRTVGPTLPPLAPAPQQTIPVAKLSALLDPAAGMGTPAAAAVAAPPSPPAPRGEKSAPTLRPVSPPRGGRVSACCWPIGEPGKPSFRFCDAEAISGKPYCAEHVQLAYVKIRDRREEAA